MQLICASKIADRFYSSENLLRILTHVLIECGQVQMT